jgi:hypothetical protein
VFNINSTRTTGELNPGFFDRKQAIKNLIYGTALPELVAYFPYFEKIKVSL